MDTSTIYQHSADYALRTGEYDHYRESSEKNRKCANAIDEAIIACNFDQYLYKFSDAAKSVVDAFGFDRVNWVLAVTIHQQYYNARYSDSNRRWAREFSVPDDKYPGYIINTHPTVLDGFINSVRAAHREMLTEAVGSYEKSHHMADRNRLTCFSMSAGALISKAGVTDHELSARYNEILEKKSVLEQIRAARREEKAQPTPKAARKKDKQGPEI